MFEIPTPTSGRLAILARPRGGNWLELDVDDWKRRGFELVISALTESEMHDLELLDEPQVVRQRGLAFDNLPIADRGIPLSRSQFEKSVGNWAEQLNAGRNIGVHCRQGIGRSGMIAVGILQQLGINPLNAIQMVTHARGVTVPETEEQQMWIRNSRDRQLVAS